MIKTPSKPPGAAGAPPFLGSAFLAFGSAASGGASCLSQQRVNNPKVWIQRLRGGLSRL